MVIRGHPGYIPGFSIFMDMGLAVGIYIYIRNMIRRLLDIERDYLWLDRRIDSLG